MLVPFWIIFGGGGGWRDSLWEDRGASSEFRFLCLEVYVLWGWIEWIA